MMAARSLVYSFYHCMYKKFTEQFSIFGILATLGIIVLLSTFLDIEKLKEVVIASGPWAPLLFVVLKILTIVVAPISGSPLYPLVGWIFGFWPGLAYVALGDFLGYSIAFYMSRIFGQKRFATFLLGKDHNLIAKLVGHLGTGKGFFQACLVCFPLPEVLSYAAGLSTLSYTKFILILWPASTTVASLLVLFGAHIEGLLTSLTPFVIAFGLLFMALGSWRVAHTLAK
jgi:uncharacterized membrane protein YdjX (TVP38/TMEM64 family)